MPIDLNKPLTLPRTKGAVKKGINLAKRESRKNEIITLAVGIPLIVMLALGVAKFGVVDQLVRLNQAENDYNRIHERYEAISESAAQYDKVLLEYRTYSMEWMDNDKTGKYVAVERLRVLKMVEQVVNPRGDVQSLSIRDNMLSLSMTGMNLKQITEMFNELETYPFVADCVLKSAKSKDYVSTDYNDWLAWDLSEEPVTFTVAIYLVDGGEELS